MIYTIINKTEIIQGVLIYTPFGYTNDNSIIDTINSDYDLTLGQWIEDNKTALNNATITLSDYEGGSRYVARTTATNIEGLTEITNLNQLEWH